MLPICGGGCANKRLRVKHFGEEGLLLCSPYKDHLTAYLEEYYDTFLGREICAAVLAPGAAAKDETGYRMVQPRKRRTTEEPRTPADPIGHER
jgi:uncharacterized protein